MSFCDARYFNVFVPDALSYRCSQGLYVLLLNVFKCFCLENEFLDNIVQGLLCKGVWCSKFFLKVFLHGRFCLESFVYFLTFSSLSLCNWTSRNLDWMFFWWSFLPWYFFRKNIVILSMLFTITWCLSTFCPAVAVKPN